MLSMSDLIELLELEMKRKQSGCPSGLTKRSSLALEPLD